MQLSGTAYHPELGQLVNYSLTPLSEDPDRQVEQTIQRMRRHVIEDSGSAPIQRDAALIRQSGTGDPISDSFWWVKNRINFWQDEQLSRGLRAFHGGDPVADPIIEVLVRPRDLADMQPAAEDCDGFASYLPALLRCQGVPCSFVTVAADPREPGRFSHVYAACTDPATGQRISLDASHGAYPGWECTESGQVTRLKEWPIDGPDWGTLFVIAVVLYAAAKVWGVL